MAHRNARLTPTVDDFSSNASAPASPLLTSPRQWVCHASALIVGSTGSTRPAPTGSRTAHRDRTPARPRRRPTSKNASSQRAASNEVGPTS